MNRDFLKGLGIEGLTKEVIDQIMDEHGKTVNANKAVSDETIKQLNESLSKRAEITPEDYTKLKGDFSEATKKLKGFDGIDVVKIQEDLATAKGKISELETTHSAKISELETDALLREHMAKVDFSSDYAKKGVYEDLKSKVKYEAGKDGSIGALTGFEEALEEIRSTQPSAFVLEDSTKQKAKDEGARHKGNDNQKPAKEIPLLI